MVQSLFQQYDRSPSRVVVNKNQVSRSEDEAKKEVAATIEDEDEEDKEIMEVLGAEEVDTELDYEVNSEMKTIRECSQKMKCIKGLFSFDFSFFLNYSRGANLHHLHSSPLTLSNSQ